MTKTKKTVRIKKGKSVPLTLPRIYRVGEKEPPPSDAMNLKMMLVYPAKSSRALWGKRWMMGYYLAGLKVWKIMGSPSDVKVSHFCELPPNPE